MNTLDGSAINIKDFFQTSSTLWIDFDFTKWILSAYEDEVLQNKSKLVKSFDLTQNMSDSQITEHAKTLGFDPRNNPVTLDQIKTKIEAQPNGTEGEMLTNGSANLFYVFGKDGVLFTVDVRWYSGYGRWSVCARRLDRRGGWNAGRRLFCNRT